MAPIRRYLRISAYSVLEVRIYLDNPADAHRWLLLSADPALPRIIHAIRPLVLPKLREENERSKKGSKKKSVKDVVTGDDFEVSIFLTELSTSHSLLTKAKVFGDGKSADRNGGTRSRPMEIADEKDDEPVPNLRTEESEGDGVVDLASIPLEGEREVSAGEQGDGDDDDDAQDDKKKAGFRMSYDGFRIHGKILCLVVKRRRTGKARQLASGSEGQAIMENWIASTQENPPMLDE